jgi:hypothetical protein
VVVVVRQCVALAQWFSHYAFQRRAQEYDILNRLQTLVTSIVPGACAFVLTLHASLQVVPATVKACVCCCRSDAALQVFGSFMNGLAVPDSDVDVLICNASCTCAVG